MRIPDQSHAGAMFVSAHTACNLQLAWLLHHVHSAPLHATYLCTVVSMAACTMCCQPCVSTMLSLLHLMRVQQQKLRSIQSHCRWGCFVDAFEKEVCTIQQAVWNKLSVSMFMYMVCVVPSPVLMPFPDVLS